MSFRNPSTSVLVPTKRTLTRRSLLKNTAALFAAAQVLSPAGLFAQGAGPEVKAVKLGFIALTDAAPLIIAKEKGFFAKYGLPDVEVLKQASWGALRDNLALGGAGNGIDGAHILSPLPYLMATGRVTQGNQPILMAILVRLNAGCQGISVSNEYKETGVTLDAGKLKAALLAKKAAGKDVKAAVTFPGGTHDLWMRYWLAAGGIDPDKDVQTIVVPPPQMVANMKVGSMDMFCVGEPWNEQLVNQGLGFTALTTSELWMDHPEKALAMRGDWVEKNPIAAQALTAAVIEAQIWCEAATNKAELVEIISKRQWFNVPPADISGRLLGEINYGNDRKVSNPALAMKFFSNGASFPYQSHDAWFIAENMRWGRLPQDTDIAALIKAVNRADIWRNAAKMAGVDAAQIPTGNSRGIERFFDGVSFDPANPAAYLKSLAIKRFA